MSDEQPMREAMTTSLPTGSAPDDHPGWRLAFRLVDLGCGDNGGSWIPFIRITVWTIIVLIAIAAIFWLAGPWFGVGSGGLYGLTRATKATRRMIARRRKQTPRS